MVAVGSSFATGRRRWRTSLVDRECEVAKLVVLLFHVDDELAFDDTSAHVPRAVVSDTVLVCFGNNRRRGLSEGLALTLASCRVEVVMTMGCGEAIPGSASALSFF